MNKQARTLDDFVKEVAEDFLPEDSIFIKGDEVDSSSVEWLRKELIFYLTVNNEARLREIEKEMRTVLNEVPDYRLDFADKGYTDIAEVYAYFKEFVDYPIYVGNVPLRIINQNAANKLNTTIH